MHRQDRGRGTLSRGLRRHEVPGVDGGEVKGRISGAGILPGGSYNHYERHFQLELGPLDSEEQLEKAAKAVGQVKAEFDSLRQEFEESTGCRDLLLYFHGSYTLGGEEHHGTFHLSMREGDSWGRDYPFYDYRSYLEECIEKTGDIPNID